MLAWFNHFCIALALRKLGGKYHPVAISMHMYLLQMPVITKSSN